MFEPLLVLELVPLILSGAISIGVGVFAWVRGPRTPLLVTLTLLLVFLGHLALVGALLTLPNDPGIAWRLFPVFQLAVTGSGLAFLVFLFAPHLSSRRLDALLSSIAFAALLLVGLVLWQPALYWGTDGEGGPLLAVKGIRAAVFALGAWLLAAHAFASSRFPQLSRSGAFLLSVGFAFVSLHHAATATLRSLLNDSPTPDAGYLAAPILLGLFVHLIVLRSRASGAVRRQAGRYLLVGLVPALLVVIAVDLLVLRLMPAAHSHLMLGVVLEHLWLVALAASVLWVVHLSREERPLGSTGRDSPVVGAQNVTGGWGTTIAPRSRSP